MTKRGDTARDARAVAIHRLNAGTNVALAGGKIAIGLLAGSPALVAHGLENGTDLLNNLLAWIGHRVARVPADEDHHFGHANAEPLAACAIGLVILVGGVVVVYRAITGQGGAEPGSLGAFALAAAVVSGLACEGLSRVTYRAAAELESQVLAALARDKRADALTSVVVCTAVGGSLLGVAWLEPLIAGLMGVWIAFLGAKSLLEGLDVLMGRVRDPHIRAELEAIATGVGGVRGVQALRIQPLGSTWRVDLEISVDGSLSVARGHEIAHDVEDAITRERDRVVEVSVHVNPG